MANKTNRICTNSLSLLYLNFLFIPIMFQSSVFIQAKMEYYIPLESVTRFKKKCGSSVCTFVCKAARNAYSFIICRRILMRIPRKRN